MLHQYIIDNLNIKRYFRQYTRWATLMGKRGVAMNLNSLKKLLKHQAYHQILEHLQTGPTWKQKSLDHALYQLASQPAETLIATLLSAGANPNQSLQDNRYISLHRAAIYNRYAIAELLLSHGANCHAQSAKQQTPLHLACLNGHFELAQLLWHNGADLHAQADSNFTPWLYAASSGNLQLLRWLLDQAVDIDQTTANGISALTLAAWNGHQAAVEWLLANDAAIEGPPTRTRTPLHAALSKGHMAIANLLLDHGAAANAITSEGNSCVCLAAWHNATDLVDRLLQLGSPINCAMAKPHATALHAAAQLNNPAMAQQLLANGAKINALNPQGLMPFHTAISTICATKSADLALIEVFLRMGADPNQPSYAIKQLGKETQVREHWRPLGYVLAQKRRDLAECLLAYGAELNLPSYGKWAMEQTPLEVVASAEVIDQEAGELFSWLLSLKPQIPPKLLPSMLITQKFGFAQQLIAAGADLHAPDVLGAAITAKNEHYVHDFLARGVNVDSPYRNYTTVLQLALSSYPQFALRLIEAGADLTHLVDENPSLNYPMLIRQQRSNRPAISNLMLLDLIAEAMLAQLEPANPAYQALLDQEFAERVCTANETTWQIWLARGANIHALNHAGLLGFSQLCVHGDLAGAQTLYANGANINQTDHFGRTALHWAVERQQLASIQQLLAWAADMHSATPYGYTALHYAALANRLDLVELLLQAKADPTVQLTTGRLQGWTALHCAYAVDNQSLIKLLHPLTPTITPPEPGSQHIQGTYDVTMAHNGWHKPRPISQQTQRCPACAEHMLYNTAHSFDGSGQLADRIEIYRCGNCQAVFWENSMATWRSRLQPWSSFVPD
ncbi:MAG TPA: hypothetical protein DEF47_20585 [Herpetosiphon sp.]|nr:hypothetical protein [Herpetosiphon sp.]